VVPGAAPVRVTNQPYYDGAPSWSPDGHSIAFESGPSGDDGGPGTSLFKIPAPALAPGGPSLAAGYLVADRPTAPSYTPALVHQYNSTRASNTVTRSSTGIYQAHLPGLGAAAGGTVDVTPYGATPAGLHCVSPSWTVSSGAVVVNVRCYTPGGALADGPFTLAYTRAAGTSSTPFAYVWGNSPTTPSYTPPAAYRYNSSGGTNTIARTSTGRYVASLPGLGGSGGAAMVTATAGSNLCKVVSWSAATSVEKVSVACNSSSGAAADTSFALSFARGQNLLGDGWRSSASAVADQPATASYTPTNQSTVGTSATIARLGTGRYRMTLGSAYVGAGGDVQVAGVGTGGGPCAVLGWQAGGFTQQVDVQCTSSTGAPADERFVATYRG